MDDLKQNLAQHAESMRVEYKSSFQKEVIETIVAFANTDGGDVFIGITDARKIAGVTVSDETLQDWLNQIKTNTYPSIMPSIETLGSMLF